MICHPTARFANTRSNILSFPKEKIVREPVLDSAILKDLEDKSTLLFAEEAAATFMEDLMSSIAETGIDITDPILIKDSTFVFSVLRATIFRCLGISHPLQEFMDNTTSFVVEDPDTLVIELEETET